MLKNYVTLTLRLIWKRKLLSLVKIGGLTIGIASFLLLMMYLKHESSYDRFYQQEDKIFRVTTKYLKEGFYGVDYPAPFSKAMVSDIPEIEMAGRYLPISWFNQVRPSGKEKNFYEEKLAYVDADLFDILEVPLLAGEFRKSMTQPNTVSISSRIAKKYFGSKSPINKQLFINDNTENPYRIVSVFKDFPSNSHLDVDFMISLAGIEFWPGEQQYWGANIYNVYVKLNEKADIASIHEKLPEITTNYFLPSWTERKFSNPAELARNIRHELQPVHEIYLSPKDVRDDGAHGSKSLLLLFGFAGILIIAIAFINYINLSTAGFSARTKEVGIRKVMGAGKKTLTAQFLIESVVFSILSFILGWFCCWLVLPHVNPLFSDTLSISSFSLLEIGLFLLIIVVLGLLSGLYPSFGISKLTLAVKNQLTERGNPVFRNALVVFQFVVSVVLIICTIVVSNQLDFMLSKDLGFEKEQVLIVKGTDVLKDNVSTFKEAVSSLNAVEQVSISDYLPVGSPRRFSDSFWEKGLQDNKEGVTSQIWQVDNEYVPTLGIDIIAGRNFQESLVSDSTAILISSTLAAQLHLNEVIGSHITNKDKTWQIIGVYRDFHFESLENEISPSSLILGNPSATALVKFKPQETEAFLSALKEVWSKFSPTTQMRYEFMDDSFALLHEKVEHAAALFNFFASLTILISCLGLFSLTAFVTDQRGKEIGIRKVLGASLLNIISLLSKDFIKPILIAIAIAIPLGVLVMENWLQDFAYRTPFKITTFLLAGIIALTIALFTIAFHSIKASLINPTNTLLQE
ncbi:MAG: ABC transporter permease [Bacteroidota bacterium]